MKECSVRKDQLVVDGAARYLCGGEVQYFRLPRAEWKERLRQAKEHGCNTVSSCMPWYWHEREEGRCDLTGATRPECDLRAFMQLVAEAGLMLIARPGPFVNSELRCGGIPEWLFRKYPETHSRRGDGAPGPGRPCPAEGEPLYRAKVREWYRQVVPLIAEFDAHRGGPVILFQPDNELSSAWSYGLLNSLYDPAVLGEHWPKWLAAKYGDVDVLNRRYGTHRADFANVEPPRGLPVSDAERARCFDWMDFKRIFFAEWGATLVRWAIEDGIRVPVIFNEPVAGYYGHGDHAGFGAVMVQHGLAGVTACHTYSDRILDLDGILSPAIGIELVKSSPWGGPPMSEEIGVNWYLPRLIRSEVNWQTLLRLGLGHGLKGGVIYPYAAGLGPFEDTIDGPIYWPQACIGRDGRVTASCRHVEDYFTFVQAWEPELAAAQSATEITVAYTPGQRLLDFLGVPEAARLAGKTEKRAVVAGGELFDAEPTLVRGGASGHDWLDGYEAVSKQTLAAESGVWRKTREAVGLLHSLNVGYALLDLTNPNREPGRGTILVASTGCLEPEAIDYLVRHLDAGGRCLFCPTIPVMDLDGRPDARIADRLGTRLTETIRPAGGRAIDYGSRVIEVRDGEKVGIDGWLFAHEFPAGSDVLAAHEGKALAAALPAGNGRAAVVGFDPFYTSEGVQRFWAGVLRGALGIEPAIRAEGAWFHALLTRAGGTAFLTVMNLTGTSEPGRLILCRPAPGLETLSLGLELGAHEARCLVLNARLGDCRLISTTSELTPLDGTRSAFKLRGHASTRGELVFDRPVSLELDGRHIASQPRADGHVISYTHERTPLTAQSLRRSGTP